MHRPFVWKGLNIEGRGKGGREGERKGEGEKEEAEDNGGDQPETL